MKLKLIPVYNMQNGMSITNKQDKMETYWDEFWCLHPFPRVLGGIFVERNHLWSCRYTTDIHIVIAGYKMYFVRSLTSEKLP